MIETLSAQTSDSLEAFSPPFPLFLARTVLHVLHP